MSPDTTAHAPVTPPRWTWRSVPWIAALFIAVIVVMAAWDIVRSYRTAIAETSRELDAYARVIAEQTARSLQTVDRVLGHVAGEHRSGALAAKSGAELHAYLKDQSVGLVQIEGLSLVDAAGRVHASSAMFPMPDTVPNISTFPLFQSVRDDPTLAMVVDRAARPVIREGPWVFRMVRRLEDAGGEFDGVVAAGGRVEYYQHFYRDMRLDNGTSITLLHRDGSLVARLPPVEAALGRHFPLFDALLAARAAGRIPPASSTSPIDGIERFASLEHVADQPLDVIVSRDAAVALAPWRQQTAGTIVRTLALGALALFLLGMVRRQFVRLDKARESLELSRERFALAAAGSDDGIWDWNLAGDLIFASARAREIFGLQPGPEVQTRDEWYAQIRIHPEDIDTRREAIAAHLAGKSPAYAGEYRVRHADGRYRWVRVRGLCVRNANGHPTRMAGSVSDIDSRRRAEDALRLSEERYALAMTGSTGGHWVWEVATDALFVSDTVNQLFGLPADTRPGTRTAFFARVTVHKDDLHKIEQINAEVLGGQASRLDYEYRIVLPGSAGVRWILNRAQCFRDAEGIAVRMAGVSVDISERKRTEEALRLSEERFALAVAGSNDGIIDWDVVGDRMYTSERAMEMLGVDSRVTVRTRAEWLDLFKLHPDDRQRHTDELRRFLESDGSLRAGEYRVRRSDGGYRWVRLRNLCIRDTAGRPLRLAGSVSDIDAYKRVESALRQSEERYALAMTGSNEGHWVWDMPNDQVYVSPKLRELFCIAHDAEFDSYASYFAQIPIHPDDRERVVRRRTEHLEGKTPQIDHEFRIVMPGTGEIRWMHTRGQCFRDADGNPMRVAGSTVDATQRKQAEESLRRSEERYALSVAGSDDGVWDWDFGAELAFESARARELQGLPPGPELQPLNTLLESLRVHPDDGPRRAEAIRAHLAGETPAYESEYRVRHDDGVYRWIRVRALCTRDATGKPRRMAGSVSDIDARRRAEEALRQSEERFSLAVAGANDGILDWDIVNDSMYVSERTKRLVGLALSRTVFRIAEWSAQVMPRFHPDDMPRVIHELHGDPHNPADSHEGEYRVLGADGQYRWVRFRGRSVRDAQGRAIRWAGSVSDVDGLKRTEEALRRSEERYALAVAGSNEGLWDWDLIGDSLFLSPRAQEILWLTPGEPQRPRREWIALAPYHPDDRVLVRNAISAHLHGATPHFQVEYRLRHPSGEWRWYRQRGVAVRDAQGRPTRMAGSMEDITDRKQAEGEREQLEAQLRQAQKLEAIGTLAGGIAHDFNNILAAILGYGEMAQRDAAEGTPLRRHIDAALSAGMRAKSLVERILAFSRSGMAERVPVRVESVVSEALDLVEASLPAGIVLERSLAAGDAAILGDATQVHQVVMNLCANAVQAIKDQGRLTVTLDLHQAGGSTCATSVLGDTGHIRLSVRDTGAGIAPQVLERIFDPFFTTKEVGVGTGLGLSLVHGIVTDLGGGIDVESQPGAGSTFTVYLPWQASLAVPEAAAEVAAPNGNGETILLVDDEEPLVRLGEEMLAELGYEPVGFTSSLKALETFRAEPDRFHAVLSDEAMPEMTGSELVREILTIRPDIPIVMMSGYVTLALSARAREAGVAQVLSKPLDSREIARGLAHALQR